MCIQFQTSKILMHIIIFRYVFKLRRLNLNKNKCGLNISPTNCLYRAFTFIVSYLLIPKNCRSLETTSFPATLGLSRPILTHTILVSHLLSSVS